METRVTGETVGKGHASSAQAGILSGRETAEWQAAAHGGGTRAPPQRVASSPAGKRG